MDPVEELLLQQTKTFEDRESHRDRVIKNQIREFEPKGREVQLKEAKDRRERAQADIDLALKKVQLATAQRETAVQLLLLRHKLQKDGVDQNEIDLMLPLPICDGETGVSNEERSMKLFKSSNPHRASEVGVAAILGAFSTGRSIAHFYACAVASVENAYVPTKAHAEQLAKPFVEETAIKNELRGQHRRKGSVCTSLKPSGRDTGGSPCARLADCYCNLQRRGPLSKELLGWQKLKLHGLELVGRPGVIQHPQLLRRALCLDMKRCTAHSITPSVSLPHPRLARASTYRSWACRLPSAARRRVARAAAAAAGPRSPPPAWAPSLCVPLLSAMVDVLQRRMSFSGPIASRVTGFGAWAISVEPLRVIILVDWIRVLCAQIKLSSQNHPLLDLVI
ncbi:hypothetical protein ON010_g5244 [Phytophthora cinnamomi]|nr:hypothetical protein ON010_g5244 [Phytophthora cinnamomi]